MRIPRTNFYPAPFGDEDHDDPRPDIPYQEQQWHAVETLPEQEEQAWHGEEIAVANDVGRPRFRSPALRGYDPSQNTDGSWESHFYLAPNVRFTRTPDKIAAKPAEPAQDEVLQEPAPSAAADTLPSENALLQRLREALDERRRKSEADAAPTGNDDMATAVASADPVVMPVHPVALVQPAPVPVVPVRVQTMPVLKPAPPVAAPTVPHRPTSVDIRTALSQFAHLSDHAFWETLLPESGDQEIAGQKPAFAQPARPIMPAVKPVSAPVSRVASMTPQIVRMPPDVITSLFRVVECRTPQADVVAEVSADMPVDALPALAEPAPLQVAEAPEVVAPIVPAVVAPPVAELAREPASAVLSRSKPFQINLAAAPVVGSEGYEYPPHTLLQEPPRTVGFVLTQEQLEQNAGLLESVLEDFGVRGEIIHVRPGPVVTLYEFEPAPGVKSSRVIGLADDIARSMSALSARVAVVPGRNVIGIELPNVTRETVYFREMIDSADFLKSGYKLPICLGKTIGGEPVIAELAKMPHLLVAGTTGSGKSVAINTMILSLLYRFRPEECRLIMVDPKMLELSIYDGIPHLLTPVVTDPKKAVMALKWAVREMEDRYRKMSRLGVRNIDGYNSRAAAAREKGETITMTVQTGFEKGTGEAIHENQELTLDPMPYIVVIVDEMADLMMVAGKEIEGAIQRLAQMARAAGIHLIMATQRPSVDVITGTIKANFPTRISFQVTSKIDSRTILGEQGAEQLLGQGDMLHMAGGGRISRVHGPFVSDEEVEKVVMHLKTQGRPEYLDTVTADEEEEEEDDKQAGGAVFDKGDMAAEDGNDLYDKAVKVVLRDKKCSTSYIQRRLAIGYNRAASLVERMEKEGLVGPANHVGKREIINGERDAFGPMPADDAD
jgi:S-DNA-T family DNA segregation ATPase FtsK/SpoIIIE